MPALMKAMSSLPKRSVTSATARFIDAGSVTSASRAITAFDRRDRRSAASPSLSASRSTMQTAAPFSASTSAQA
jgi:hypothetical protein